MNLLTRFFGPRRRAATENCSKRQPDTPSSDAKKTRKSTTSRKSSLSSTATSTSNESETLASASHSRRSQSKANVNASLAAKKQEVKFDCSRCIRSTEIEYQLVTIVVKSWEQKILKIPNWDIRTGDILLRHCFRLAPVTISLFGFPEDTKYDDPSLSNNKVFVGKGSRLIKAFDQAASFLGPDLEPFEAQLYELGWRHVAMKAQPDFWPVVGEALMCTFEDCMIGGFTAEERRAWTIIYNFMGYHMIQGLVAHYKELDEIEKSIQKTEPAVETEEIVDPRLARSTNYRSVLKCDVKVPLSQISFTLVTTVVDSWSRVTSIPNWETVTGDLFLRYIFKLAPATMELFGFPAKTDYRDPELVHNRAFLHKGVVLIKAIDTAVSLLGPDVAPLEGVLYDLGKRHVNMMAQPEHWPVVGEALFLVFEECMEGGFSGDVRKAWTIMYNFLGFHMIEGLKFQYKLLQEGK